MERLPNEKLEYAIEVYKRTLEVTGDNGEHCYTPLDEDTLKLLEELKAYRDAEEQGLLVRLPCKVGDTVWDNDFGRPCRYRITEYSFGIAEDYIDEPVTETEIVYYYTNSSGGVTGSFASSEIGKTVFLTKEEAEQKLASMQKGE